MQTANKWKGRSFCLAMLVLASGCATDQTLSPVRPGAVSLTVVSGDAQFGAPGAELALPLVIVVTDNKGKGVNGVTVNFRVVSGGGSMWAGAATTDVSGIAQDYWTLGTSTQVVQRVEVRAVATSVGKEVFGIFNANVRAGTASRILISGGDGQSAAVGTPVGVPPSALVTDAYGNAVAGAIVTFSVLSGGGVVTGASQTTNSSGIATATSWTLGAAACDDRLSATAAGLVGSPLTFVASSPGNCWTTLASMPTPRWAHRLASVNGILYAVGGLTGSGTVLATVEAYNPSTNSWTTLSPMPETRGSMALAVVNGTLYVIAGGTVGGTLLTSLWAYDVSSDTWIAKAPIPLARAEPVAGVASGIVYAIGGQNASAGGFLSAVESYDPFGNVWTSSSSHTPMPTPRYALALGVIGGLMYAVGGEGNAGVTGALEVYDPLAESWTNKASMPTPRLALGVGVSGGLLYAVGGAQASAGIGTLEVYDPATNQWTTKTSMPTGRYSMGVAMVNGILYTVGGNHGGAVGTVEAYRP